MEFKSVSDWRAGPGLCRCCLSDGCYKDISNEYFWKGDKEVYADMLLDCFDLTISYQECGPNSNSRLICEVCIQRLRDAFSFKKQVVSSERRFSDYVKALASGEKPDLASFHEVKVELIKGEKAPSEPAEDDDMHNDLFDNLDDDDDDDADNQPLKNFASQLPKVESDTMQDIPAFDEDLIKKEAKVVKRKYTKKATSTSSKKAKPTTDDPEASSSKIKMDKKKGSNKQVKYKILRPRQDQDEKRQKLMMKHNLLILLEHTTACPFRWSHTVFKCYYCENTFSDIKELHKHNNANHFNTLESMSKTKWYNRHIKAEISDLKCRICNKTFVLLDNIKTHLIDSHAKKLDLNFSDGIIAYKLSENFNCHICEKQFNRFSNLSNHLNEHYRNYVCDICGAPFSEKDRLRQHFLTHGGGSYSCKQCNKTFESAIIYRHHVARFHKNSGYRYCCPLCSERFKEYAQRIHHMGTVHKIQNQNCSCPSCKFTQKNKDTSAKRFQCPECSKKFTRKREMVIHQVCHTGERNFKCEICSKSYARDKTLKEHMRIHNDDRRYACPECGRTFIQKHTLNCHLRVHFVHK